MNTKQAIVLITPSSGGKDYFLEILEEKIKEMGKEVSNIKFAVMTRQITMNLLFKQLEEEKIITTSEIKEMSLKEKEELFDKYKNEKQEYILWHGKNVRQTLQYIAETLKKALKEDNIHIGFAFKKILEAKAEEVPVVTDCRFENEMKAMLDLNSSKNKEEYIRKYISNLNLEKTKDYTSEIIKYFEIDKNNTKDIKVLNLILKQIEDLKKYILNMENPKQTNNEKLNLYEMTTEDFFDNNIIILTRYITEEDIEKQKKQYKIHGINFNDKKYKLSNNKQRYIGSAHPEHIAEQLAFKLPEGFLNATNSPNLKDNLLPQVINKISSPNLSKQNKAKKKQIYK